MSDTQVLIIGAGPTGLVLALWLNRLGVRVRIVDKTAEPGTTSRALVVHARTLEFYRQVGLAEAVVERALKFTAANLWAKGTRAGRIVFGAMGQGLSPFPYMLILPQDEHERLLIERLAEAGVQVERRTELLGFEDSGGGVLARLRQPDRTEEACEAPYLAGCDGARSRVREVLSAGFPGGTYSHLFYVADVAASGPLMNDELHVALDEAEFVAVFPMKGAGRARLVGTVRQEAEDQDETLSWEDVGKGAIGRLGIVVERVNWFSTYRVHHRVADFFRRGCAFLLGDAAHIHSPVGGQGMNTGIGDAVNLAWKLAAVLHGRAETALLDTYEPERIAFARRLVATTDRAFTVVTSPGPIARFVRVEVAPRLLPALFAVRAFRRLMFRTVSQIAVDYRGSSLSEGRAGRVRGGDRLPWVAGDNFSPLSSLDWQVHVYGAADPGIVEVCGRRGLALHSFPWHSAASRAGLERGAVYLVRPDGYVGLADPEGSPGRVERYLETRCIRTRESSERQR
jgi:2-polyprenyl-6-methoxyphenol hydroxylase-like FAD-dependent oxidoreductase